MKKTKKIAVIVSVIMMAVGGVIYKCKLRAETGFVGQYYKR